MLGTPKALFTPAEAATYLGLGRTTIYRLIKLGELDSIHVGSARRITRESMDRFIVGRLRRGRIDV